MALNKQAGNMYPFVNYSWNPIRGFCQHQCQYCYYQNNPRFKDKIGLLRLEEKELKINLGEGRFIFVGSSTDMFADEVPTEWIKAVLKLCRLFPDNNYLFQSKNPKRFTFFEPYFPPKVILGTTIETNFNRNLSLALSPFERKWWLASINVAIPKMVSIEPIVSFDLGILVSWMREIGPKFVSIGADSKGHHLPEPTGDQLRALVEALEKFTVVRLKPNLNRIWDP